MKVTLGFVPPGGGELGYSLEFELPSVPCPGDYISIQREDTTGTENFIVRRSWWNLSIGANGENGRLSELWVECEFAEAPMSSENHERMVQVYESQAGKKLRFDSSLY